ncbi:MAG: ABC transporter permease [Firmicutes bacterium]|nr:ABC transporter permease [Bacillota bacterium]MBQ3122967.1 ABC transporter permease [Bacillota bacterium]MBQ9972816.1 ABC transporter permease [Bacillota bacterium]
MNRREKKAFIARSNKLEIWYRLRHNTSAIVGFVLFAIILLACFTAPLYLDYETDIIQIDAANKLQGPSKEHIFGTDEVGRDVLNRILWGGKTSITMGLLALGLAFLVGTILGTIAAYFGGVVDMIIMRLIDVVMAVPILILMITLAGVVPPTNVNLVLIIGVALVPQELRLVRAQVLQLIDKEYIEAVKIQGGSGFRIIVMHILPNAIGPIITTAMIDIASAITTISTLSFMGLGVQPPDPEWGSMLANGKLVIRDAWNISTFPGIALLLTVIALTLIGDGLRDALDPRMRR